MNDEQWEEAQELHERSRLIDTLRDLGAVDLRRPRRTMGFERRQERADDRPRTAPAWGNAPYDDR